MFAPTSRTSAVHPGSKDHANAHNDSNTNNMSLYLLLENARKSNNLGPILRCAAAFGVRQVLAIGYDKCSVDGSHGAAKHVHIQAFPTVPQAIESMSTGSTDSKENVAVIGILGGVAVTTPGTSSMPPQNQLNNPQHKGALEVYEDEALGHFYARENTNGNDHATTTKKELWSYPIDSFPFDTTKTTYCFVLCKSKRGLTSTLAQHCHAFCHVPHQNLFSNQTNQESPHKQHPSLLEVESSLSIVLSHCSEWAHRPERTFEGHKFDTSGNVVEQQRHQYVQDQRKRQLEEMLQPTPQEEMMGAVSLFGNDSKDDGDY